MFPARERFRQSRARHLVMSEAFPDKPKGMHWQTHERLRRAHHAAEWCSMTGLLRHIDSRDRQKGARQ